MLKLPRWIFTVSLFFLLSATATAQTSTQTPPPTETEQSIDSAPLKKQTSTQPSSVIVTATATSQRVRYVSIGEVNQTRVQVFSADGAEVFDSSYRLGNLVDWQLTDQQGQHLADGSYLFLVTVKDFSGALTQKYGTAQLEQAQVSLEQTSGDELPRAQAAALEANKVSAALFVVDRVGAAASKQSTASTDGAASIDNAPADKPTAMAEQSTGTANLTGSGTQNILAKWIDNSGTIGNSTVVEFGGNVGIGTAAPNYKLVVGPALQSGFVAAAATISNGAGKSSSVLVGPISTNAIEFGWDFANARAFFNAPSTSPIAFTQNGSNVRMYINNAGNIGIGTTTPGSKLVVAAGGSGGDVHFGTPNGETGMSILGASGRTDLRFDGTAVRLVAGFGSGAPAPSSGVTVDTGGRVYIGKVATGSGMRLNVYDTNAGNVCGPAVIGWGNPVASGCGSALLVTTSDENAYLIEGLNSLGEVFSVNGVGRVHIGSAPLEPSVASACFTAQGDVVQCGASSLRFKTNVRPFLNGLDIVRRLRPISFNWKEGGASDIGLAAEAVAKVAPSLTFINSKGEAEGVRYERLNILLINAIQQQQAQLKQLRTQLLQQQAELNQVKRTLRRNRAARR